MTYKQQEENIIIFDIPFLRFILGNDLALYRRVIPQDYQFHEWTFDSTEYLCYTITRLGAWCRVIYAARAYISCCKFTPMSSWLFYRTARISFKFKERGRLELVVTNNEEESFLYLGCKIKLLPYAAVSFSRSSSFPPRNPIPSSAILFPFSLSIVLYLSLSLSFSRANSHTFLQPLTESSLWKHYVRAPDRYSNPTPKLRTRWWGKSNVPRENNSFGILMSFHLKISRPAKNFDRKPREREFVNILDEKDKNKFA